MANFKNDILEIVGEEKVEGLVIGKFGWDGYGEKESHKITPSKEGKVLSFEDGLTLLDYEYDSGYGAPDCHAIYIWTSTRVIWVTQYDGLTRLNDAPRNPTDIMPDMPGE